jgi:hypothetical protein
MSQRAELGYSGFLISVIRHGMEDFLNKIKQENK